MKTWKKLWKKIRYIEVDSYKTDNWRCYDKLIPQSKRDENKKDTYTIESWNCRIRHYLARFKRKTKCYSKSDYMIYLSVLLFVKMKPLNS